VGKKPANPHKYWVFRGQSGVLKVGRNRANGQKFDQNSDFLLHFSSNFSLWSKISGLWSNPKTQKWAEK
jgi:hypothetical protein